MVALRLDSVTMAFPPTQPFAPPPSAPPNEKVWLRHCSHQCMYPIYSMYSMFIIHPMYHSLFTLCTIHYSLHVPFIIHSLSLLIQCRLCLLFMSMPCHFSMYVYYIIISSGRFSLRQLRTRNRFPKTRK